MSLPILLANRLIKLLGNTSKVLCYPFHYIFPKKRFYIPRQSNPFVASRKASKIPKIIWQTNYSNYVSLPIYFNYFFNRLMSLSYEYRYVSTEERLNFITNHATQEIIDAYKRLRDGASQADLWRLLVLHHFGGVYMDIDAHLVWPLSRIIKCDDKELFVLTKHHYTNYFLASEKNTPILKEAISIIVDNIDNEKIEGGVYELTGPIALNIALEEKQFNHRFYRYTCVQGSFTNEYFQYIDKPEGKWNHAKPSELLRDAGSKSEA